MSAVIDTKAVLVNVCLNADDVAKSDPLVSRRRWIRFQERHVLELP